MTRNRFILLLENHLAETFPGWQEREKELTYGDLREVMMRMNNLAAKIEILLSEQPEVKA